MWVVSRSCICFCFERAVNGFVTQEALQARAPALRFLGPLPGQVAPDEIFGLGDVLLLLFPLAPLALQALLALQR